MITAMGSSNRTRVNVSEAEERRKKIVTGFGLFTKSMKSPEKSVDA